MAAADKETFDAGISVGSFDVEAEELDIADPTSAAQLGDFVEEGDPDSEAKDPIEGSERQAPADNPPYRAAVDIPVEACSLRVQQPERGHIAAEPKQRALAEHNPIDDVKIRDILGHTHSGFRVSNNLRKYFSMTRSE